MSCHDLDSGSSLSCPVEETMGLSLEMQSRVTLSFICLNMYFFVKVTKSTFECYLLNNYLYILCYLSQILMNMYSNSFYVYF